MALKIGMASAPEVRDEVFKVRHKVFVEEEGLLRATEDGRLIDRFDAYPTTRILAVTLGDEIVGSLRLSLDSPVGLPADTYYDFRKHVPETSYLMHTSLLCLSQAYRGTGITVGLDLMATDYGIAQDVSHVVAPINPRVGKLMKRCGFDAVGEIFIEPHTGAEMVPLVGDLRRRDGWFIAFIDEHGLHDLLREYERWFCQASESILTLDAGKEDVFLVVDGSVMISEPGSNRTISELGPGQFFGDLDALPEELRSGQVVALDNTQLLVWPTELFDDRNRQTLLGEIANMFARRTRTIIDRLAN